VSWTSCVSSNVLRCFDYPDHHLPKAKSTLIHLNYTLENNISPNGHFVHQTLKSNLMAHRLIFPTIVSILNLFCMCFASIFFFN
jgi:hypothetical protein